MLKTRYYYSAIEIHQREIEYEIIGEGSQICRYCLRRKGLKSQLLAGEGSQISLFWLRSFGGRRVTNHKKLAGEGSQIKILPPKSCRLIFKIEGPEKNQIFDLNRFAPDKRFLVGNWTKNKNKWVSEPRKISFCPKIALSLDGLSGTRKTLKCYCRTTQPQNRKPNPLSMLVRPVEDSFNV